MNIVITGAMNDMLQPAACDTHIESAVPTARRRIRTWAISNARYSEQEGDQAQQPHLDPRE